MNDWQHTKFVLRQGRLQRLLDAVPVDFLGADLEYIVPTAADGDKAVISHETEVASSEDRALQRFKITVRPPVSTHDRGAGHAYLAEIVAVVGLVYEHVETREWKARS